MEKTPHPSKSKGAAPTSDRARSLFSELARWYHPSIAAMSQEEYRCNACATRQALEFRHLFRDKRTEKSCSPNWKAVACSLVLLAMNFASIGSVHARQVNQQAKTPPSFSVGKVTFTLDRMQDGFTKDGARFYGMVLSASNGATIYENTIPYRDVSDADQEVDRMVHLSVEIIRQTKETDKKGRITGRRFLIRLPSDKSGKPLVWLVWNDGKTVHEVSSDSLDDLLVLEHVPSGKGNPPK